VTRLGAWAIAHLGKLQSDGLYEICAQLFLRHSQQVCTAGRKIQQLRMWGYFPSVGLFLSHLGSSGSGKSDTAEGWIQRAPMSKSGAVAHSGSTPRSYRSTHTEMKMIESTTNQFELRFQSLFHSGRGYAFPCDPKGQVDLDRLSDRTRMNYLYARAMVGRELAVPAVRPRAMH
jgi:hypothetical protein